MNIALVINSLGSGGAERVVSLLATEFADRGHDVTIVLRNNAGREARYGVSDRVQVVDLSDIKAAGGDGSVGRLRGLKHVVKRIVPFPLLKRLSRLRARRVLRRTLVAAQPDVVLSFMTTTNIETTFALRGLSIPIIVSERSDPRRHDGNLWTRLRRDRAYREADGVVFQTAEALAMFPASVQARSKVIPNPLDLPDLERTPERGVSRIVSVGRLVESKQFDHLIRCVARLRESGRRCRLEIYGEGPEKGELEDLIRSLGLQDSAELMGFRKDLLQQIVNAAVFVLSSTYEGMPNALLEAMGLGLPVVSTDCPVGGPRAVIRPGDNGLLYPVGDDDALFGHLCDLLDHPDRAERMGSAARDLRVELKLSTVAGRWLEFAEKVLRERKGGRVR